MLAAGVLFMVLGAVLVFLGMGGASIGSSAGYLMLSGGSALFLLGIALAIAGAIVNAIDRAADRAAASARALEDTLKKGVESLWKQLDVIRANAASPPTPPLPVYGSTPAAPSAPQGTGMGYCPGCNKLRGANVPKCIYCGNSDPVTA